MYPTNRAIALLNCLETQSSPVPVTNSLNITAIAPDYTFGSRQLSFTPRITRFLSVSSMTAKSPQSAASDWVAHD